MPTPNPHHVLVEEVDDHAGQPAVAPVAVHQHQLPEVFEPAYGEVARHYRLGESTAESCSTGSVFTQREAT